MGTAATHHVHTQHTIQVWRQTNATSTYFTAATPHFGPELRYAASMPGFDECPVVSKPLEPLPCSFSLRHQGNLGLFGSQVDWAGETGRDETLFDV